MPYEVSKVRGMPVLIPGIGNNSPVAHARLGGQVEAGGHGRVGLAIAPGSGGIRRVTATGFNTGARWTELNLSWHLDSDSGAQRREATWMRGALPGQPTT